MKSFVLLCALLFSVSFLSAQQTTGTSTKAAAKQSATVKTESPEHIYAQKQQDSTKVALDAAKDEADKCHVSHDCSAEKLHALSDAMTQGLKEWEGWIVKTAAADDCAKIYRATANKKQSDVTVKEADQINGCKEIDSFPPRTK